VGQGHSRSSSILLPPQPSPPASCSSGGGDATAARARVHPLEQAYILHTLVLADDHPVVRNNLKKLLNRETDFHLVAEADNGLDVVRLVESWQPDLLVTDLAMPGLDGLEVTHTVRRVSPHTRIIVISVHREEPYVIQALQRGASAYVLKSASPNDLVAAARAVLAGQRFLSAPFSASLLR
jgi:DNA-binding NarL/FixJ family response regulator